MNTCKNSMFAAAGLLMLNGVVAFAQTQQLKVDVPFTFHAAGATLRPGKYEITRVPTSATPYYNVRHESGKSVLVVPASIAARRNTDPNGAVIFECAGEYCALKRIDLGFESPALTFPVRIAPGFKGASAAEVRIPALR